MDTPHVVGIPGSLREQSYTRIALNRALDGAERAGGTTTLLDLRDYELPLFDGDQREPGDVPLVTRRIRDADSILLGTPVYHASYSSPLKTVLDYCGFDEFENKTVGLLTVSGGGFPVSALDHLRIVCRSLNAWVIPHQVAIPKAGNIIVDGEITNEEFERRALLLGRRAVQYADIEPDPDSFEGDQNVGGD